MAKETIQLTETEVLRLELYELKMGQAAKALADLRRKHDSAVRLIEDREGIEDIRHYQVNNETGEGRLIVQKGPENERSEKSG